MTSTRTFKGFTIRWSNDTIVSVRKDNVAESDFDRELSVAHHLLTYFRQSKPGTTWGCDGIGYIAQKRIGVIELKKSGVGPRKFADGMTRLKREVV